MTDYGVNFDISQCCDTKIRNSYFLQPVHDPNAKHEKEY